jgi:hypothetical protein
VCAIFKPGAGRVADRQTQEITLFSRLFGKKPPAGRADDMIVAQLNAKLQPMHRGEHFEDPLDAVLKKTRLGEVSGGGTMQEKSGEIAYCDIEITLSSPPEAAIPTIIATLEELGAPKGSTLRVESSGVEHALGKAEGLAVYLNGTDLPAETYTSCDSNFVYSEFDRLLAGEGRVLSYWQGPTETALYMYGGSFPEMKRRLEPFIASYPLCQRCRVAQIA